jgi:hypothetical protein
MLRFAGPATLLEHLTDLGDVAAAPLTGGCIETELHRDIRGAEQAQLGGGVMWFSHVFIMTRGCHTQFVLNLFGSPRLEDLRACSESCVDR